MARRDSVGLLKAKIALLKGTVDILKKDISTAIPLCSTITTVQNKLTHESKSLVEKNILFNARENLHNYIDKRLGRSHAYYTSWAMDKLNLNTGDYYFHPRRDDFVKQGQLGRIAWANWMIQCLEEDLKAKQNG